MSHGCIFVRGTRGAALRYPGVLNTGFVFAFSYICRTSEVLRRINALIRLFIFFASAFFVYL